MAACLGTPPESARGFEPTAERQFAGMIARVARAAQYVHDAGLLHLDIKPSNVLVRRDGSPLLADFGVVREIDFVRTLTRSFAGTPSYAAPEQLRREDGLIGPRSDVYGLGMTLYELLARERPLQDESLPDLLRKLEAGDVPALAERVEVAAPLANIVHRAIERDPDARYASAAAFADDLEAFLADRPVQARTPSRYQRLRRWARTEPWKAISVLVLLVTIPAVSVLAATLWQELPTIRRDRERLAQQQRLDLIQRVYQQYFGITGLLTAQTDQLRRAMADDPEDRALACLAAILHEEDHAAAAAELDQHPAAVARHRGLAALRAKAVANRPFFDPAEVEHLRTSGDEVDWLVLAIDRVLWAEDEGHEEAHETAHQIVATAIVNSVEEDLLLYALMAWTAARAAMPRELEFALATIDKRWPDHEGALVWRFLAIDLVDRARARGMLHEHLQRHSGALPVHALLCGAMARDDAPDLPATVERALAQGMQPHMLAGRVAAALEAGGATELFARVWPVDPAARSPLGSLQYLRRRDPHQARRLAEELLTAGEHSLRLLVPLSEFAEETRDHTLTERLHEVWERHHPGRKLLDRYLAIARWRVQDRAGAGRAAHELTPMRRQIDDEGPILCEALTSAKDWTGLERVATRLLEHGETKSRPRATYSLAVANARLGRHRQAHDWLVQYEQATNQPWPNALIERAWLSVDPDGDPELRRAEDALGWLDAVEDVSVRRRRPAGPWMLTVKAEALFANGRPEEAAAAAELALERLDQLEPQAPADCEQILRRALARYRP
jgi:hypothetical protein